MAWGIKISLYGRLAQSVDVCWVAQAVAHSPNFNLKPWPILAERILLRDRSRPKPATQFTKSMVQPLGRPVRWRFNSPTGSIADPDQICFQSTVWQLKQSVFETIIQTKSNAGLTQTCRKKFLYMGGSKSKGKHYGAWANEGCFVEVQYLSKGHPHTRWSSCWFLV